MKRLLIISLLLAGCVQRQPVDQGQLGEAEVRPIAPPFMSGNTGIQQWDRSRYKPSDQNRDRTYFACLQETAGKGREPFDACMSEKGYTR